MKFKGMPGLTVTDGKNIVEFPFNGILELKGKKAKWLKELIESGKVKGIKILGNGQLENAEEQETAQTEETDGKDQDRSSKP